MNHPDTLAEFARFVRLDLFGSPVYRRVYLAGPMRGKTPQDLAENFATFAEAAQYMRELMHLEVFDPAQRDVQESGFDPLTDEVGRIEDYMAEDLPEVCRADAVVVLPGWVDSQGARIEATVASLLGKPVYRYSDGARVYAAAIVGEPDAKPQPVLAPGQKGETTTIADPAPAPPAAASASGEQRAKDATTGGEKCFKPERFEFIPAEPMRAVARVYGYGASKYADRNWERGYDWGLSYGALQRHLHEFWAGRSTDPESGCHHLAHAVFHCLALMEWELTHPELDSRPGSKAGAK